MLTLKLVLIEIAFVFYSHGNPNGCTLDYFFKPRLHMQYFPLDGNAISKKLLHCRRT